MKYLFNNHGLYKVVIVIFFLTFIACSPSQNISNSTSSDRDGSTKEKAIIVKSVSAEYEWIRINYPGSKTVSQALLGSGSKHYDLLTFVTEAGETKEVYLDISSFFGKF